MYRRAPEGWLKHYDFALLDMICLQLAFILAYTIRNHGINPYSSMLYRNMAMFIEVSDMMVIFFLGTLKGVLKRGHYREFVITVRHAAVVGAMAILFLFLAQESQQYSRIALILTIALYIVIAYTVRELWKCRLKRRMVTGGDRSLLIVTSEENAEDVIRTVQSNNYAMYRIAGVAILDRNLTGTSIAGVPVVADQRTAPMYVCQEWIDEVLMVFSESAPYPGKLIGELEETGVTLHMNLSRITSSAGKKQFVERVCNYTVLTTSINCATTKHLMAKRVMDIAGGLAGCLLTGIIFLFVAPAIYISSPGPIFFAQERVGKNGKKFKMYKFRSMYMDAEERKAELMKENKFADAKMFKMDFDPRVIGNRILPDGTRKTGIGNFIRVTSLDEFPQFFNVLKGDMSIVGTRPPLVGEVSEYELHHRARLAIKPGITGMWQISGRSDITDFEEVVRMDREYICGWNIGLDVKILLKTVLVVLGRRGSV